MDQIPGLKLGPFEYTTVKALRDEKLSTAELGDTRARQLIREKSQLITDITEQWFVPVAGAARLNGKDGKLLYVSNLIPIVQVSALHIIDRGFDDPGATGTLIPDSEYVVQPRWIELVDLVFKRNMSSSGAEYDPTGARRINRGIGQLFPSIPQVATVNGVFGWLEDTKPVPFESTTSADLAAGVKTVSLTSVSGLVPKDVLVFGDGDTHQRAIVNSISGTDVAIPSLDYAVPSGTRVRAWGKVPRQIERAVQFLVYMDKCPPFEKGQSVLDTQLVSGAGGEPSTGISTGSRKVDIVLAQFLAPPIPRLI